MKSVMVNQFRSLPDVTFQRNTFDRSFGYLTTLDAGKLYPVFVDEVVPGQTKSLNANFFGRINTMIVPSYVNAYLDFHLWFVPNRLIWDNWSTFLGETFNPYGGDKKNPDDYLVPIISAPTGGFPRYGLADYMGIPPAIQGLSVVAPPFRAYNLIWNCFYRSETLQDPVIVPTGDGPDDSSLFNLLPRGKRFDYFTSCLPEPQRGESVYLPLGSEAPVKSSGTTFSSWLKDNEGTEVHDLQIYSSSADPKDFGSIIGAGSHSTYRLMPNMHADLTEATSLTVQSFRNLIALNLFLERENRYGNRVQEIILGHFGVTAPDYRLQVPEFLGGTTVRLNVSSVPQTSGTPVDDANFVTPQANLSAYGVLADSGSGFFRSFVEHGWIIGLVSIRCDLQYQQGVDRMFKRRKKLDFLWPEFAGISDQEVYNYEIFVDGTDDDNGIFGYQERYGEYRYHNSFVTGKMRSSDPQSLDIWHTAQDFKSRPKLNSEFIVENPPIDRIIAVQDEPQFTLDCFFDYKDTSPLPLYGVPGLERL